MHALVKHLARLIPILMLPTLVLGSDYLDDARTYYKNKEYRAAIIQLKNELKASPDNRAARILLGRIHLEMGNPKSAEKEYRRAQELEGERSEWLPGLAQALLEQGEFAKVLNEITLNQEDPRRLKADISALHAQAYMARNEKTKAEKQFNQALELESNHADALLGLAALSFNSGDLEQAHQYVDAALEQDQSAFPPRFLKAQILAQQQRDEAVDWYDKALEIRPGHVEARIGKARALIQQGDFESAGKVVQQLQEVLPNNPQVNHLHGLVEFSAGNYEQAKSAFNQVLASVPSHPPAMLFLGTIHYQENNADQAELYLKDYLDHAPEHVPARQMLGAVYLRKGEEKKAIETMLPVIDSAADNAGFLAQLGEAYIRQGEIDKGIRFLEKASAIAPDALPLQAQIAMGRILQGDTETGVEKLQALMESGSGLEYDRLLVMTYIELESYQKALQTVKTMREKYPENADVANLHGVVHLATGDRDAAKKAIKQAIEINNRLPAPYINLANIEFEEGNQDAAIATLQRAKELGIESPHILLTRARMAEAMGKGTEETKALYRRAYETYTDEPQTGLAYADYLTRAGMFKEALAVLSDMNQRHTGHPKVLEKLGILQMRSGNYASAEINIRSLLDKMPQSGPAHLLLGRLQLTREQFGQAIETLKRAAELSTDNPEAKILLAQAYAANRQGEKALQTIEQVKQDYPEIGAGFELEGDLHLNRGEHEQGLAAYKKAYELSASRPLLIKLYRAHKMAGNNKEAAGALRHWLEANPDDIDIRLIYAAELTEAGNNGQALAQYRHIAEINPDHLVALNNAAALAADIDPASGLEYAEKAYAIAASRPEVIDTYGWLLLINGETKRAERLLKEAVVLAPHIPEIRYHLALAYHKNGKNSDALMEMNAIKENLSELSAPTEARNLHEKLRSAEGN